MSNSVRVPIVKYIDTTIWSSPDDGKIIKDIIEQHFSRGNDVELSFEGAKYIISAFLNIAIGGLYRNYDSDYLNSHLKIVDATPDQISLIAEVAKNAKRTQNNDISFEDLLDEED